MTDPQYHNANDVSNSSFLVELARGANRGTTLWTTAFTGNPDGSTGWHGGPWEGGDRAARVDSYADRNCYFSTAALKPDAQGELHRRKANFDRLLALVVDDADQQDLLAKPSWVLETSPGKIQVGFLLDISDPRCADERTVTSLVIRLADRGLIGGDKSGNNIVRYVRLPCGWNQKPRESGPFQTVLRVWHPEARYTLEDAAAALGIDLDEILAEAATAPSSTSAFTGWQDEKLETAISNILAGQNLHDSVNVVAASLVASGTHPGAAVNTLRAMMQSSLAPKDARWQARYADIARAVTTACNKFMQPAVDAQTGETLGEALFLRASEMLADLKPIEFLVAGYLENNAISMFYGPPGCGKSFVAIDIGLSVATGKQWHGSAVDEGPVFMIIGEGHNGYARRLASWAVENKLGQELMNAPVYVSRHSVQLGDEHAALSMAAEVDRMIKDSGKNPKLVIIDTLARNFGPGDENSTKDMSAFVANVDKYLRLRYGCHVMIVHHTGNDESRARGNSAMRGAIDQQFRLTGQGGRISMLCQKMKDAPEPVERRFKIKSVPLGCDKNDEPIDGACVVLDGNPWDIEVAKDTNGEVVNAYAIVREWSADPIMNSVDLANRFSLGGKGGATTRLLQKLVTAGILVKVNRWYELTADTIEKCQSMAWEVVAPSTEVSH